MARALSAIPKHDRPREKLMAKGAASLSDRELLAVLLGSGTTGVDVLEVAGLVAKEIDKRGLAIRVDDLRTIPGMGVAKAMQVLAALEFARRRIKPDGLKITTPADVLPLIRHYADRRQEHFLTITINGANEVLNVRVISIGLVDRTPVHPREVFADAVADRASGIIVAHNHPAGNLEPSPADRSVTKQLKEAGAIMGIQLLDHIIFDRKGYYSFLETSSL